MKDDGQTVAIVVRHARQRAVPTTQVSMLEPGLRMPAPKTADRLAHVYIDKLAPGTTQAEVEGLCLQYGNLQYCRVEMFPRGGYGLVTFDNPQSAAAAISGLNGTLVGKGDRRLEVSIRVPGVRKHR